MSSAGQGQHLSAEQIPASKSSYTGTSSRQIGFNGFVHRWTWPEPDARSDPRQWRYPVTARQLDIDGFVQRWTEPAPAGRTQTRLEVILCRRLLSAARHHRLCPALDRDSAWYRIRSPPAGISCVRATARNRWLCPLLDRTNSRCSRIRYPPLRTSRVGSTARARWPFPLMDKQIPGIVGILCRRALAHHWPYPLLNKQIPGIGDPVSERPRT